jgi:tetratricopeptide (TPR) repeat protein
MQLYRAGEYYLASQQLSKAVHCGVCSADTYKALANIAERRGDLRLAAKHWDTVSSLDPDAVLPHYKAAMLYLAVKRNAKAYQHTVKARDRHNRPKPMNDVSDDDLDQLVKDVADACLRAGQLDVAHTSSIRRIHEKLVWVNRALSLHPSAAVYARVGRYYERLGDLCTDDRRANYYDRAVENLKKARKLKPGSSSINTDLVRCLNKQRV